MIGNPYFPTDNLYYGYIWGIEKKANGSLCTQAFSSRAEAREWLKNARTIPKKYRVVKIVATLKRYEWNWEWEWED